MTANASPSLTSTVEGVLKSPVFNNEGEQTGTLEIDAADLGGKINRQLLHDVVLMYLANRRRGTHSTKRRGEVAGSTKKLFRQKGTGNARVGTRRTNKRRGGGTAKGPKPRDYTYRLPKKAVRSATKMALLSRFADGETLIIDDFGLEEISTGDMAAILANLEIDGQGLLIGLGKEDADDDATIYLSARNIPLVETMQVELFNAYDLLRPKALLLTKAAVAELFENANWTDEVPEPAEEEDEGDEDEGEEED